MTSQKLSNKNATSPPAGNFIKLTFIGSGSAFTVGNNNYHSNMIIESASQKKFLLDCGSDARHALFELGLTSKDIDALYISHLHADHVGGLEWLAFNTYKNKIKIPFFLSEDLVGELWNNVLSGGLRSLDNISTSLSTFFVVHSINLSRQFLWEGIEFQLVKVMHVRSEGLERPCYGLFITFQGKKIFITSDTRTSDNLFHYYQTADIIFHDCETSTDHTGVHTHYNSLKNLDNAIKSKMWLYHYNPGILPDARKDGFLGFVEKGQQFLINGNSVLE
jgi:ribonuclease BN (tRNA processing enzyme)